VQVSFPELVTVFVLEELRSPVLREWVEAQQAVSVAADDATGERSELSEEDAALKIQSGCRGGTARKEVAERRKEERQNEVQSKYDEWRGGQDEVTG